MSMQEISPFKGCNLWLDEEGQLLSFHKYVSSLWHIDLYSVWFCNISDDSIPLLWFSRLPCFTVFLEHENLVIAFPTCMSHYPPLYFISFFT